MTTNERELIDIVRNSPDPQKVAEYMLTLFSDYLRTHGPSQERPSADQPGHRYPALCHTVLLRQGPHGELHKGK